MPLNKYSGSQTEDEICSGCKFLPTKQEAIPAEIAAHVSTATDLSELYRSGARFAYPDGLSPAEWACMSGLTRGRGRADTLEADRDREKRRIEERTKQRNQNG